MLAMDRSMHLNLLLLVKECLPNKSDDLEEMAMEICMEAEDAISVKH